MRLRVWFVLSLCAGGITWLYLHRILAPWADHVDAQKGVTQMGDLYPRWVGTRELLLHGGNPYSPEVSHEIQTAFYGHAIEQEYGKPGVHVVDEQRFAYPVYVVFLLAPTVHLNFSELQFWALIVFAIFTVFSVRLWLDVVLWRPPRLLAGAIALFILSSPQIAQGLRLRQLGLIVGFLLALSAWCIVRNQLAVAGIILAVATIKPQMVVLPLGWFLVWGFGGWSRRWPLLAGFGVTLAALAGLGELILPGWPRYFAEGLVAYGRYAQAPSLLLMAGGGYFGMALSIVIIAGVVALSWRHRQADAGSPEFSRTLAASLIASTLVLPLLAPFNQLLLVLPVVTIIRDWALLPRIGRRVFGIFVAWPWLCSFGLLWLRPHLESQSRLPLLPSVTVLFVPFLLLLLFVMKWSHLNYPQLPATNLRL
jgi:Glycosyltransferase family 87